MSVLGGGLGGGQGGPVIDRPDDDVMVEEEQIDNQDFDWEHCQVAVVDQALFPNGSSLGFGEIEVHDIGQGNCVALVEKRFGPNFVDIRRPLCFIDFGIPMFFMKQSAPGAPGHGQPMAVDTGVAAAQSIFITHWDWDHWAGALYNQRQDLNGVTEAQHARGKNWFVPRQELGNTHLAFATDMHQANRLFCLDFDDPLEYYVHQLGKFILLIEGARVFQDPYSNNQNDVVDQRGNASYWRNNVSNVFTLLQYFNTDEADYAFNIATYNEMMSMSRSATLFPGDADYTCIPSLRTQMRLCFQAAYNQPVAMATYRYVIATHHGSGRNMPGSDGTRRADNLFDIPPRAATQDSTAVISSGLYANGARCYGHPNANAITEYQNRGWTILTTAALFQTPRGSVRLTMPYFPIAGPARYTLADALAYDPP